MMDQSQFLVRYKDLFYIEQIDYELELIWGDISNFRSAEKNYSIFKNSLPIFLESIFDKTIEFSQELERTYDSDERFLLDNKSNGIVFFAHSLQDAPNEILSAFFAFASDSSWHEFMGPLFRSYLI